MSIDKKNFAVPEVDRVYSNLDVHKRDSFNIPHDLRYTDRKVGSI